MQNGTTASQQPSAVDGSADSSAKQPSKPPSVKAHLSRELQHYYQRLVSALAPSADEKKRTAALTSLRADAGLAPVLPYVARWVAEGVVTTLRRDGDNDEVDLDRRSLAIYLDVISALLENERLLVEPYVSRAPTPSSFVRSCMNSSNSYTNSFPQFCPFYSLRRFSSLCHSTRLPATQHHHICGPTRAPSSHGCYRSTVQHILHYQRVSRKHY